MEPDDRRSRFQELHREPHEGAPSLRRTTERRYSSVRPLTTRGGSSNIVEGFDEKIARPVALKRLSEEGTDPETIARFFREAHITAWLDHPNVIPIYDMLESERGELELVMKLVEGTTLTDRIRETRGESSELRELITMWLKACDAIQYAHESGVVHRDLKPDNIMVGRHGEVYVMDWGIAKIVDEKATSKRPSALPEDVDCTRTLAGTIMGSPAYLSPEQARGDHPAIDTRTDVFGLGTVLYQILTGVAPYSDIPPHEILSRACKAEILSPRERAKHRVVRPDLDRLCMRALARRRADRFQSVEEFASALRDAMAHGNWFEARSYEVGAIIVREGDPSTEAFLIEQGRCAVLKRSRAGDDEFIRELGPGEFFGEAGLFTAELRSATVQAIEETVVQCIDRQNLESAFSERNTLGLLARSLAARFLKRERELLDREDGEEAL